MPQFGYSIQDFPCKLEDFSGPFELLLSLASKEEIDTRKIPLLEVISQFLQQGSHDVDNKSSFTHEAAWLHVLKSIALTKEKLPDEFEIEEKELKTLLESFEQLQKSQAVASLLERLQKTQNGKAFRPKYPLPQRSRETTTSASLKDLQDYFKKIIAKSTPQEKHIPKEEITYEEEKQSLIQLLSSGRLSFVSLFDNLSRERQINRFLVILELIKQGNLRALFDNLNTSDQNNLQIEVIYA